MELYRCGSALPAVRDCVHREAIDLPSKTWRCEIFEIGLVCLFNEIKKKKKKGQTRSSIEAGRAVATNNAKVSLANSLCETSAESALHCSFSFECPTLCKKILLKLHSSNSRIHESQVGEREGRGGRQRRRRIVEEARWDVFSVRVNHSLELSKEC